MAGTTRTCAPGAAAHSSGWRRARRGAHISTRERHRPVEPVRQATPDGKRATMAEIPVDPLRIINRFGPHLSSMTGVRLSTSVEPERLVKTHCCFCGQQCGIQLKVRDNEVIGFEPWEEFPFNRGMLCPKGVKRYLQGSHPDRLTQALVRDTRAAAGFSAIAY